MNRLTRDGTAEPVSRDKILRRERGQGNIIFPYSADHEQDWQPYPVDPYSCYMCDDIHTYRHLIFRFVYWYNRQVLILLMICMYRASMHGHHLLIAE